MTKRTFAGLVEERRLLLIAANEAEVMEACDYIMDRVREIEVALSRHRPADVLEAKVLAGVAADALHACMPTDVEVRMLTNAANFLNREATGA